jgi:ribosomal protein S18 acetylase RimI-like enzyme
MNISIRPAIPEDAYDIRRIQIEGWLDNNISPSTGVTVEYLQEVKGHTLPPSPEKVAKMREIITNATNDGSEWGWVALDGDKVVGFIWMHYAKSDETSFGIYVDRQCRDRGVGTALIQEMLHTHPKKKFSLSVTKGNEPGIRFYERCGFKQVKEEMWCMSEESPAYLPTIIMQNY